MKKLLTLCIVVKDEQVLLGMKKRGFGEGRWNGFGGKVEEGEAVEQAALRELKEEAGIETLEIKELGVIDFSFQNDLKVLEVHIFRVDKFKGKPKESEEMRPYWFNFKNIPFAQMWPDDIYWFPLLLQNKLFKGEFLFDRPSDKDYSAKIISQKLYENL